MPAGGRRRYRPAAQGFCSRHALQGALHGLQGCRHRSVCLHQPLNPMQIGAPTSWRRIAQLPSTPTASPFLSVDNSICCNPVAHSGCCYRRRYKGQHRCWRHLWQNVRCTGDGLGICGLQQPETAVWRTEGGRAATELHITRRGVVQGCQKRNTPVGTGKLLKTRARCTRYRGGGRSNRGGQ